MTHLEQLIAETVARTTLSTISSATEKLAEEIARDMLKDPQVRGELLAIVRQAFADTWQEMRKTLPDGGAR